MKVKRKAFPVDQRQLCQCSLFILFQRIERTIKKFQRAKLFLFGDLGTRESFRKLFAIEYGPKIH